MVFTTSLVLYFTFFNFLVQIQSAVKSPDEEDNVIIVTESAIRNTLNKLFSSLKLKDVKNKLKLKQYSKIHNYFVSVTLQDYNILNKIAKITRAEYIDKSVQIFITQINEVLSKDNKIDDETDAVYITMLIQTFLDGLDHLKEEYGIKSNASNLEANKQVLKYLSDDERNDNATQIKQSTNDTNDNILDAYEFWKVPETSGRRIYMGRRVTIEDFPFMASIQFFKKFQCAGSIIKSDLVITSAACLQLAYNNRFFRENPAFLSVMVGSSYYEIGDENIPILEVYFHPNYDPKTLKHNLAILRLLRTLNLKKMKKIKKINFDRNPWPMPDNTDEITIVGWGARGTNNIVDDPYKNHLAFAVLQFYPLGECQDVYSKEYVTRNHFCAGFFSKGGGACNRDAGGPGLHAGVLMGVISFGAPSCGAVDAPTVFTKLGYYTDWIESIMEEERVINYKERTTPRTIYRTTFLQNNHYKRSTFVVTPIMDDEKVIIPPSAINTMNKLRSPDQNNVFKDFLSTMFESGEIDEYLAKDKDDQEEGEEIKTEESKTEENEYSIESDIEPEPKQKPKSKTRSKLKTTPKISAKHKSKSKLKSKYKSKSDTKIQQKTKRVTEIDKYDVTTKTHRTHATKKDHDSEEDRKADQVLERLISKLDEEDLLKNKADSGEPLEFPEEENSPSSRDDGAQSPVEDQNRAAQSELEEAASKSDEGISDAILTLLYLVKNKHEKHNENYEGTKKQTKVRTKVVFNGNSKGNIYKNLKKNNKPENIKEKQKNYRENIDNEEYIQENNYEIEAEDNKEKDGADQNYEQEEKVREQMSDANESVGSEDESSYAGLSIPSDQLNNNKANSNDTDQFMEILSKSPNIYDLIAEAIEKRKSKK